MKSINKIELQGTTGMIQYQGKDGYRKATFRLQTERKDPYTGKTILQTHRILLHEDKAQTDPSVFRNISRMELNIIGYLEYIDIPIGKGKYSKQAVIVAEYVRIATDKLQEYIHLGYYNCHDDLKIISEMTSPEEIVEYMRKKMGDFRQIDDEEDFMQMYPNVNPHDGYHFTEDKQYLVVMDDLKKELPMENTNNKELMLYVDIYKLKTP